MKIYLFMKNDRINDSGRILKQPKLTQSDIDSNPILNKLVKKMNNESFMSDENDILKRLEEYKKKKSII